MLRENQADEPNHIKSNRRNIILRFGNLIALDIKVKKNNIFSKFSIRFWVKPCFWKDFRQRKFKTRCIYWKETEF